MSYSFRLEDQKIQDAQDDGERHKNTGYPVEEPEQSPETHDGHGCPYGGYAVRYPNLNIILTLYCK